MLKKADIPNKIAKTEQQWQEELDEESYHVLRKKGTERAFTGRYWNLKDKGIYNCAGCGLNLFSSDAKYDSGSGWPSFYQPSSKSNITELADSSGGMIRTEVICKKCESHLGHVFPDGPPKTGLRYCINSASLVFKKIEEN
ncbi:MAG: peptide-methionine (R)-S-oxide reductase MsrB [Pseudomonadales bacterium]|jgi:peptide-methionine (R)-S-oxide reductase|nr:peptide-methionine (R)-S-oxide reductase MsrB [Pseudomonadales bacterium]MEC8949601.1 peptide-methionine (R)-S-oxide reductase MsrB [Pseudomonadota bacterium]MEE3142862.1 peptide-methionine (R)-S-oxide reductase MsrB [Pseudomonadota bacterium]|tara:strand:- start:314 stop:736 length:423 start_codon:yes stop_codon:yes gene_type:complete